MSTFMILLPTNFGQGNFPDRHVLITWLSFILSQFDEGKGGVAVLVLLCSWTH